MGVVAEKAKFSIPSIIAIVAAGGSFMTGAFLGFMLAMLAVVFGIIGLILSFSPRIRGGIMSSFAILAGLLGFLAAIVKGLLWLF